MKSAALLLALSLTGCYGSPTEPVADPQPTVTTGCPLAQKDEYGFCIPAPPPPPCGVLNADGKPYPNCIPTERPGPDVRP